MSIVANSINSLTSNYRSIEDEAYSDIKKYFTLYDNKLDGSYNLIDTNQMPLWGSTFSNTDGTLPTALIIYNDFFNIVSPLLSDWESGRYSTTGVKTANTGCIRTVNLIPVLPSTQYRFNSFPTSKSTVRLAITSHTSTGAFLSNIGNITTNNVLKTMGATAAYISISVYDTAGTSTAVQLLEWLRTGGIRPVVHKYSATAEGDNIHALKLTGDIGANVIPVDFTYKLYNGSTLLHTTTVTGNTDVNWLLKLPQRFLATYSVLTITKINKANFTARVTNIANSHQIKRIKTEVLKTTEVLELSYLIEKFLSDNLMIDTQREVDITNVFKVSNELSIDTLATDNLKNVHTVCGDSMRHIYGKVYVTYMNPLSEVTIGVTSSGAAYNSKLNQVSNGRIGVKDVKYFTLYNNRLDGSYEVIGENTEVAWSSDVLSDNNGLFITPVWLEVTFAPKLLNEVQITFDVSGGQIPIDFTLRLTKDDNTSVDVVVTDNEELQYVYTENLAELVSIKITITKVSKSNHPAIVREILVNSTIEYLDDELISVDLLEELTYDDSIGALGCISANEVTVIFSNESKDFYFNSESIVSKQLKKNRRVVPWFGVEIIPGVIEWYCQGTYWTYDWKVPVGSITATAIAFDTIGLLNTLSFIDHYVYYNISYAYALELIFLSAKVEFPELEYYIDPSLSSIIIPYVWFEKGSYMLALKKLAGCALIHIYCDKYGKVCCVPKIQNNQNYYSTWSDSTNVISKEYPTFYTEPINTAIIDVNAVSITNQEVLSVTEAFNTTSSNTIEYLFSSPVYLNPIVTINCDSSVTYDYDWYSWGIIVTFVGTGVVTSISITADALTQKVDSTITKRLDDLITLNGENQCKVSNSFIQTATMAKELADEILSIAQNDKYCTDVTYRGDIALSINDQIKLLNGIALTDRYTIQRNTLYWAGNLTGTARLTT